MIGSLGAQRCKYCCDSSDHHQPRLGAGTGDPGCVGGRTEPHRAGVMPPCRAGPTFPDVPLFMIRGGTVSNEDLEAVVATRTALSGVLPGWVAR